MSKQLTMYERGTTTPVPRGKFGQVDPGDTSNILEYDLKNTGSEDMDMIATLQKVSSSPLVEGITATIVHKRGMSTIDTYVLSWDAMANQSVLDHAPIDDYQVDDILEIDLEWSPASGVPVSPTNLTGFLKLTEV